MRKYKGNCATPQLFFEKSFFFFFSKRPRNFFFVILNSDGSVQYNNWIFNMGSTPSYTQRFTMDAGNSNMQQIFQQ